MTFFKKLTDLRNYERYRNQTLHTSFSDHFQYPTSIFRQNSMFGLIYEGLNFFVPLFTKGLYISWKPPNAHLKWTFQNLPLPLTSYIKKKLEFRCEICKMFRLKILKFQSCSNTMGF